MGRRKCPLHTNYLREMAIGRIRKHGGVKESRSNLVMSQVREKFSERKPLAFSYLTATRQRSN